MRKVVNGYKQIHNKESLAVIARRSGHNERKSFRSRLINFYEILAVKFTDWLTSTRYFRTWVMVRFEK